MTINPFILHGEEITPVRKLLYLKAFAGGGGLSEYEITGNPVAFNTNVAKPLSGFTIPFLPIQSGTGDPSPSNVRPISGRSGVTAWRTGVNLFDPAKTDRSVGYNIRVYKNDPILLPAGTYTMSCSEECNGLYVEKGSTDVFVKYNSTFLTFTLSEATKVSFNFYTVNTFPPDAVVQLEVGSTATTYTEYTGESYPVTFPATGKNLCDGTAYSVNISRDIPQVLSTTPVTSPFTTASSYSGVGFIARVNANVTYALSSDVTGANVYFYCGLYASLDDVTDRSNILQYAATAETFTPIADGYLVFMRYNASSGTEATWSYAQCEKGSSATAYEPFTNTVYGGTLDAVQGVLTVEYVLWTKNTASMNNSQNYPGWTNAGVRDFLGTEVDKNFYNQIINIGKTFGVNTKATYDILFLPKTSYQLTQDEWIALAIDVQIAIPLATPIEIQLDPITVQTLIGDNTIWSDTNGENAIKYKKKG